MTKIRYSAGLKIAAVAAQQIFSVILVLSVLILAVLYQKEILNLGDAKDKSFESSGYFSSKFQETAEEILNFTDLRRKFETDGSYDSEKEIDMRTLTPTAGKGQSRPEGKKKKDRTEFGITWAICQSGQGDTASQSLHSVPRTRWTRKFSRTGIFTKTANPC